MSVPELPRSIATAIGEEWRRTVLSRSARDRLALIGEVIDLDPVALVPLGGESRVALAQVQILVTGWGGPSLSADVLDTLPSLELVVHAAGSVRGVVTDESWRRGVRVSSASAANAVAVVEFAHAQIQLALKNAWALAAAARTRHAPVQRTGVHGQDDSCIGLIGLGQIGVLLAHRLRDQRVTVLAYDPTEPDVGGVTLVSLEEIFERAHVVSLHAPLTPSTVAMVDEGLLSRLRPGATFINTARGALVDHDALVRTLRHRQDVTALLDVTEPEPLPVGHELFSLPNVVLTPHIAGSLGTEEGRLGALAVQEIARWCAGAPLEHEVVESRAALTA